jgi:cyclophilin family peptidyl-prolyl cis-trans isomerase
MKNAQSNQLLIVRQTESILVMYKARITALAVLATLLITSFACGDNSDSTLDSGTSNATSVSSAQSAPSTPTNVPTSVPTSTPEPPATKSYDSPPKMSINKSKDYIAVFELEKGENFTVDLYEKLAPITVNNFVFLANDGFYDGVTFHRVIPDFMAQSGDPTGTGSGGPGYTFENEFHKDARHNTPGILSMANRGIQDGKGTNGSQFFITFVDTSFLDGFNSFGQEKDCNQPDVSCHSVFGKVTDGMDIVSTITVRDPSSAGTPGDIIKTIRIVSK